MEKLKADVVVIAAGMSGLAAAISAAEKGAAVVVLEKSRTAGGAGRMGMGLFAVESRQQKAQMVDLTVDDAFAQFMNYTHWRADARLVKKYLAQSANTIAWLEDMGVEFVGAFKYFPRSEATWHIVKTPGQAGPRVGAAAAMVRAMVERAEKLGVRFHFRTAAHRLVMDGGRVAGVMAEDPDGGAVEAACGAAIVCTGGFGDNPAMIREHLGYEWGRDLFSFRIRGLAGDGIKMVWDAGGGRSEVNMELTYTSPGITHQALTVGETMRQPNLVVNRDGRRIMNEEIMMNTTYTGNVIARQPGRCAFSLLDDGILQHYRKNGLDFLSVNNNIQNLDAFDRELAICLAGKGAGPPPGADVPDMGGALGVKTMFVAESLADLCAQTGIDEEALGATIAQYNEDGGSCDRLFNKSARYMRPLTGPRYYAACHFPSGYGTLGGIKTNDDLEVLTQGGAVIPGLYAAGTDACTIYGDSYVFILPGNTMGFAVNSGRLAGKAAADYVKGI